MQKNSIIHLTTSILLTWGLGLAYADTGVSVTHSNSNIQYVTPASQIGQTPTHQPTAVKFHETTYTNHQGDTVHTGLHTSLLSSGAPATAATSGMDLTPTNNLLQKIANNTGDASGTVSGNIENLLTYFTQDYTQDSFIPGASGYTALNTAISLSKERAGVIKNPIDLTPTVSDSIGNISVPFLTTLSAPGSNASNLTSSAYWLPAVTNAVVDLSVSQKDLDQLNDATSAPTKQDWIQNIQTASQPQLLRTLVIEQAIQNRLLYRALRQQRNQELMQASELSMLQELINKNTEAANTANNEQVRNQQRMLRTLQDIADQTRQ